MSQLPNTNLAPAPAPAADLPPQGFFGAPAPPETAAPATAAPGAIEVAEAAAASAAANPDAPPAPVDPDAPAPQHVLESAPGTVPAAPARRC